MLVGDNSNVDSPVTRQRPIYDIKEVNMEIEPYDSKDSFIEMSEEEIHSSHDHHGTRENVFSRFRKKP